MAISECDGCPRPGACCQRFLLSHANGEFVFWKNEGIGGPLKLAADRSLPFLPIEPSGQWTAFDGDDAGRDYQSWSWRCSNLLDNGGCGDYENRPQLCRDYAPLQDRMCVLHHQNLLPQELNNA